MYRQLSKLETDKNRISIMLQRRLESLEEMKAALNPNAYLIRQLEFTAELSEIYSELYEI